MSKMKIICAFLLILTISACSSSGGGGGSKGGDSGGGSSGGGGSKGGGVVVLGVPLDVPEVLSEAPGASFDDDGEPIEGTSVTSTSTVRDIEAAFDALDALETAIGLDSSMDGSITAVTLAGKATLNGYVRIEGTTNRMGGYAFGYLTITADFDAAPGTPNTVTATATDFGDFDISDPSDPFTPPIGTRGGTLSGTGMIDGTTITSTLNGELADSFGLPIRVNSMLSGDVYDADGTLVTYGTVKGELRFTGGGRVAFTDGEFAASGDSPPPSE